MRQEAATRKVRDFALQICAIVIVSLLVSSVHSHLKSTRARMADTVCSSTIFSHDSEKKTFVDNCFDRTPPFIKLRRSLSMNLLQRNRDSTMRPLRKMPLKKTAELNYESGVLRQSNQSMLVILRSRVYADF